MLKVVTGVRLGGYFGGIKVRWLVGAARLRERQTRFSR
jgi:hypothetical protein